MVTTDKTEPETEPKLEPWHQKILRNWMLTRLAHEGMMLDKIQRQNRTVEQLAAQTRDGKFNGGPVPSISEAGEMGVSIGNEVHHHYQRQPKSLELPVKSVGLPAKLIVAASLLAAGAGAGLLADQLLSSDPPAVVDTDTATDVAFPD